MLAELRIEKLQIEKNIFLFLCQKVNNIRACIPQFIYLGKT